MPSGRVISNSFNVNTIDDGTSASYVKLVGNGYNNTSYVASIIVFNGETNQNMTVPLQEDSMSGLSRGLCLVHINRTTLASWGQWFDTYYSSSRGEALATALQNSNGLDEFVAVFSNQYVGEWSTNLQNAFKACGSMGIDKTFGGGYPFAFFGYKGLAKGYALQVQSGTASTDAGAEIIAYISNGSFSTTKQGSDGASAPFYNVLEYAWNNSTTSHPTTGWSASIPSKGSNAYLWIKTTRYTWNNSTRQYDEGTTTYGRMTGEAGTSIQTKGPAVAVIYDVYSYMQDLPSSAPKGSYAFVRYDQNYKHLWQYLPTGWAANDYTFNTNDIVLKLGDSQPWKFTAGGQGTLDHITAATDGDAYSVQTDGHLWQWVLEALNWLDLGQFKGDKGDAYYTHVAWATNVYESDGNIYVVGFVTSKSYNDTTHKWMGVLVDTNPDHDSSHPEHYTWSLTKGVQGDRGIAGKFYYYAGVWEDFSSSATFKVSDAQTPYFYIRQDDEYWVYIREVTEGNYTKSQLGTPSSSSGYWKLMVHDFQYIITNAIFSSYAHLSEFIFKDEWLISQSGTIDGAACSGETYYTKFGYGVPSGGSPLTNYHSNFIPNFAVNGSTGEAYMQNATITGNLKSGSIGGFVLGAHKISAVISSQQGAFEGIEIDDAGIISCGTPSNDSRNALYVYGGAEIIGNGKNITLNAATGSASSHTGHIILNGFIQLVNVPRSSSGLHQYDLYVDSSGYVRMKTS